MEATTSAVEDSLISSLDFKIKPGASYITGRRNCSFYPSGGNSYAPNGVRVLRFHLADGWLDPSSVRIKYTLVNDREQPQPAPLFGNEYLLRPVSTPATFFRRLRILGGNGSAIIEDISDFDRVSHMFEILSTDEYINDSECQGFGFPIYRDNMPIMSGDIDRGILPGNSKTVLFKPLSGLFMQEKLIPLRYCSLTIELELVNNFIDPIVSNVSQEALPPTLDADAFPLYFKSIPPNGFSTQWHIEGCELKADLISIDSALESSYAEFLLQGKSIPIPMTVFVSQSQMLLQQKEETVNVTRSFTRLKAAYITLSGQKPGDLRQEYLKNCNNYYSPLCGSFPVNEVLTLAHFNSTVGMYRSSGEHDTGSTINVGSLPCIRTYKRQYNSANELGYQIQLGSKLYPEMRTNSNSEAWYYLSKTLKHQNTKEHGFQIKPDSYYNHEFIIGQNFEKVEGASFSGINTKMGDLMSIRIYNQSYDNTIAPNKIFITMVADQILNVSDIGCQIFD
jgi:hypothetical protein